jgi:hypothetical protein
MSLFDFFRKAPEFIEPDARALEQSGDNRPRHAAYHKRIVKLAIIFGIVGAVGTGIAVLFVAAGPRAGRDLKMIILAPVLFGIGGAFFGTAIACLIAPRDFLEGPVGQKWMKLIGTRNVLVARIVCILVALVGLLPLVAIIHDLMKGKF